MPFQFGDSNKNLNWELEFKKSINIEDGSKASLKKFEVAGNEPYFLVGTIPPKLKFKLRNKDTDITNSVGIEMNPKFDTNEIQSALSLDLDSTIKADVKTFLLVKV